MLRSQLPEPEAIEEIDESISEDMVQSMRNDFNNNKVCLHAGDLDQHPMVYERILNDEGYCVKVRPLRQNGQPVSLNQWVREWRSQTDETMNHWNAMYKSKALTTAVKELCIDVVANARRKTFPCADPDFNAFGFRNGTLRWDGTDLVFDEGEWRTSLYYFSHDFTWDDTVLPYFDKIMEAQGIDGEQKKMIMMQFGRLLSKQGNEWRCFVMLYGKTSSGKTTLLDLICSFFDSTQRWDLDQPMPERWIGSYLVKRHLVYYRDAKAQTQSLTCNQLLRLAGNEEVTSELKCQNGATLSEPKWVRLFRVGNEGWCVDNVWAVKERCFCIDFPNTIPYDDRDTTLSQGLMAESGAFAAECLKTFYAYYPTPPNWFAHDWHRTALLKYVYTATSRSVQHALYVELKEGRMEWGGAVPVERVDAVCANFCAASRRIAGSPIYHFTSVRNVGWDVEQRPFDMWVCGDELVGIKLSF